MNEAKYWFLNRPPGLFVQPVGFIDRQSMLPAQPLPCNPERHTFGWATYPEKLSFEQMYRFDLLADDQVERAAYDLSTFLESDWLELVSEYFALPEQMLVDMGQRDWVARQIMALKQAGITVEQIEAEVKRGQRETA